MPHAEGHAVAGETAPALTRISRPSAKDMVVEQIRGAIMRTELKPGQRLTEPNLAQRLGVGQATIREALIELAHLGFIQRSTPRKTFVTKLTIDQVDQIYAVRVPLELAAIDLLVKSPERALSDAEKAYQQMREAAKLANIANFKSYDLEFHRRLWAATRNVYLADVLERLVVKLFAFAFVVIQQSHYTVPQLLELADKHGRILEGIRGGDARGAKEEMVASMDKTWLKDLYL